MCCAQDTLSGVKKYFSKKALKWPIMCFVRVITSRSGTLIVIKVVISCNVCSPVVKMMHIFTHLLLQVFVQFIKKSKAIFFVFLDCWDNQGEYWSNIFLLSLQRKFNIHTVLIYKGRILTSLWHFAIRYFNMILLKVISYFLFLQTYPI